MERLAICKCRRPARLPAGHRARRMWRGCKWVRAEVCVGGVRGVRVCAMGWRQRCHAHAAQDVYTHDGMARLTDMAFTESSARCQSTTETATRMGDTHRTLTSASGAAASTASRAVLSSCAPPSQEVDSSITNVCAPAAVARRSLRVRRCWRWLLGRRLAARSPAHAIPGRSSPATETAPASDRSVLSVLRFRPSLSRPRACAPRASHFQRGWRAGTQSARTHTARTHTTAST